MSDDAPKKNAGKLEIRIHEAKEKLQALKAVEKEKKELSQKGTVELDQLIDNVLRQNNRDPNNFSLVRIHGEIRIEPKLNGQEPHGSLRPSAFNQETLTYQPYMGYPPTQQNYF